MTTENITLSTAFQIALGLEAETLRDAFAGEEVAVARAVSDLVKAHAQAAAPAKDQPLAAQPLGAERLPPIARTEAAIVAEEAQYGVLTGLDRWRLKQVAYAADVGIDIVQHVLRAREINAKRR